MCYVHHSFRPAVINDKKKRLRTLSVLPFITLGRPSVGILTILFPNKSYLSWALCCYANAILFGAKVDINFQTCKLFPFFCLTLHLCKTLFLLIDAIYGCSADFPTTLLRHTCMTLRNFSTSAAALNATPYNYSCLTSRSFLPRCTTLASLPPRTHASCAGSGRTTSFWSLTASSSRTRANFSSRL